MIAPATYAAAIATASGLGPRNDGGGDHRGHDRPDTRRPDQSDPGANRQAAEQPTLACAGRREAAGGGPLLERDQRPIEDPGEPRPGQAQTDEAEHDGRAQTQSIGRDPEGRERRREHDRDRQERRAETDEDAADPPSPAAGGTPSTSGTTGSVHGARIVRSPATNAKARTIIAFASASVRSVARRQDGDGLCSIIASDGAAECSIIESDGGAECSIIVSDGDAECSIIVSDGAAEAAGDGDAPGAVHAASAPAVVTDDREKTGTAGRTRTNHGWAPVAVGMVMTSLLRPHDIVMTIP